MANINEVQKRPNCIGFHELKGEDGETFTIYYVTLISFLDDKINFVPQHTLLSSYLNLSLSKVSREDMFEDCSYIFK